MRDFTNAEEMLWGLLITAEGRCNPDEDILEKRDIEQIFGYFRKEGLSTAYPRWETKHTGERDSKE